MSLQTKPCAWTSGGFISGELGRPLLPQAASHDLLLRVPIVLPPLLGSRFRAGVGQLGGGWRPPAAAACARATAAGSGPRRCISPVAVERPPRLFRARHASPTRPSLACGDRVSLRGTDYVRYGVGMSYINARACNQSCILISYRYGSDFGLISSHPGRLGWKTRTSTPRLKRPKRLKRLKRSSVDMILLLPNHLYGCADGCAKRFLMV